MGPLTFLTAEWRQLVMVNFAVDPAILEPRVPKGTSLDSWNGTTLVSVVGFLFLRTRVMGAPIPLHRDFEELNLRFYVKREAPDGERRGVVFIKELVPRRAIAAVARYLYNENYLAVPMAHTFQADPDGSQGVAYRWLRNGKWGEVGIRTSGDSSLPSDGSEAEFVTEHYWGYVTQRDGSTLEYRVEHPRWRVWRGVDAHLACDVADLYGAEFAATLSRPPTSAFLADGSEIVVRRGEPITRTPSRRSPSRTST
jgi:uncharacterized protein YqjF (DUF2071 family)